MLSHKLKISTCLDYSQISSHKSIFIQVLTKIGKFIDLFPLLILKGNSWVWAILYDQNDDALQKTPTIYYIAGIDQE